MKSLTPFGVSEFVPNEAVRHNALTRQISDQFETAGFSPIRTPVVEYFDTLSVGLDPRLASQSIRFFDTAGHMMILRPDHTTPIARMVASRLSHSPTPLQLYYVAPVFRNPIGDDLTPFELFQAGVEWIGAASPATDARLIALCVSVLESLGFKGIGVDIGHPAFSAGIPESERAALIRKDYVRLGYLPERGSNDIAKRVPDLAALDEELSLLGLNNRVRYNTGLIQEFNYYTGAHFEVYADGVRQMIACGGRYDQLVAKFGFDSPAVGFALNLNVIQEALAQC
jgi:ATP phosphoribosyltransferase regulatory subunit